MSAMHAERAAETANAARPAAAAAAARPRLRAWLDLVKPRVNVMVLLVTAVGFFLGLEGAFDAGVLAACLAGTACLGAGATALNQCLERREDALMPRTSRRPLVTGLLGPVEGHILGWALGLGGVALLLGGTRPATALLGALTFASYVFLYTPLKRHTPLSLYVGAIPGALPPVIGWSAAGALDAHAWLTFGILFVWQIPHFAAIGWLYREEYRGAGFAILSVRDPDGVLTARLMVWGSVLLLVASMLPVVWSVVGATYLVGSALLGAGFLAAVLLFARGISTRRARHVVHASLVYLPLLFLLMVVDSW